MSRRPELMRWLMVVVLLSVWPGGIAAAAHPNASGSRPELPHPIIPCTPAELPDQAVPIESCSTEDPGTLPDSTTTTTVPDPSTTTTVPDPSTTTTTTTTSVPGQSVPTTTLPDPTTTTTVPDGPPPADQRQDQAQLQPAPPGSDAGTIPCVPPEMPDEAVPDTCPPSDQEDPEESIGSDGLEGSPDPSAEPGPQAPPPGPTVTDPNTGSGEGDAGEDSGDSGQVPAADDSESGSATPPLDPPAPDSSTPAEPATPASPTPERPATPAEPATPPEPVQPIGVSTEADSPSSPSASVQIEPPVPSQGPDLVEVERVGELLAFLQPDALPDLAGFGAQDGATGSTAGKRPPEPALAAGLDLVLPPQLQSSRGSFQPAVAGLVTQAVQQLLRSLALPLAAAGLLGMGLIQAGGLSTGNKSRLRR
jgi:hypothetical protein